MGVKGLLPQLKEIQECLTLERFRGKTLAIDSYAWLHRSVISCSWELAQDLETTKYLSFFKKKIMMLKHFGIEPFFVFDGDNFESKTDTELEREVNRMKNREKGLEILKTGNKKLAGEFFMKSIDVTPSMAKSIIDYLKSENMKYVVAPYEADPQMVYLEKLGLVDGIISEDSDLLIFGAQCLLTKLTDFGECIVIRREDFKKCRAVPVGLMNDSQLRMVACLSGCDYTSGIPGIGIVKAFRLVKRYSNIEKCILNLKLEGKTPVPAEFEVEFKKADISFQFQRVFNPLTNKISTLNEIPTDIQVDGALLLECIGKLHENSLHHQIATGEIDPISKEPLKSREELVRSKSFNIMATPVGKGEERVAKRSYSTPATVSSGLQRIDSFFKTSSSSAQDKPTVIRRSTTVPGKPIQSGFRVLTPKSLSPTSKRRRMFNTQNATSTVQTPSSSKFFPNKAMDVEGPQLQPIAGYVSNSKVPNIMVPIIEPLVQSQSSPILSKLNQQKDQTESNNGTVPNGNKNNSVLNDLNSSDFELSDPDDDGDKFVGTNRISSNKNSDTKLDLVNKAGDSGSKQGVSYHKEVAKGLYEKFGFSSTIRQDNYKVPVTQTSKAPLKPIQQQIYDNTPRTATIKTKRSITRNLTLDSFIYRGAA